MGRGDAIGARLQPAGERPAPAVAESEPTSPIVGFPKSGLRIGLHEEASRLILQGRADPVLLYFVFAAAAAVAVGGAVLVSPVHGLAGFTVFAVLFAPLIIFLSIGALRLSTACVIDRAGQVVQVQERSYLGALQRDWPLDHLRRLLVVVCPPTRWASGGRTYELYLDLGSERYLARTSASEAHLRREAHRIARFVGTTVDSVHREVERRRASARHMLLVAALFSLPVVLATILVAYVSRVQPLSSSVMVASVSALVVCQVGAIVAYMYDRSTSWRKS